MERKISKYLEQWKSAKGRKVLLVRGARQVGKTFSVREFAKGFSSYLEVNFLETPQICKFFKGGDLSPGPILEKLQAYYGVTLTPGSGLLFFDEIQACPEALMALRFFQEKLESLHVIAAGSLLEFALAEIPSFGVGRVESLFMYPLSIEEFLLALGQAPLVQAIRDASPQVPLEEPLHNKAVGLLRSYALIGGLPAVVQAYVDRRDFNHCLSLLDDLVLGYEDDFAKYKTRIANQKLREVLRAVARQASSKFIYTHINPGSSVSGYDQALELLRLAGLVYKVHRTAANGIPLGAEVNLKYFKALPFDIGVYNRLLGLRASDYLLDDDVSFVNSGALAEVLSGLELIAHSSAHLRPELFCWAREERGSNAEVDYVVQKGKNILPIEVKAGTKGQMQSLYRFMSEKKSEGGVRTSLENYSSFTSTSSAAPIEVVPLYAIGSYVAQEREG